MSTLVPRCGIICQYPVKTLATSQAKKSTVMLLSQEITKEVFFIGQAKMYL